MPYLGLFHVSHVSSARSHNYVNYLNFQIKCSRSTYMYVHPPNDGTGQKGFQKTPKWSCRCCPGAIHSHDVQSLYRSATNTEQRIKFIVTNKLANCFSFRCLCNFYDMALFRHFVFHRTVIIMLHRAFNNSRTNEVPFLPNDKLSST